ncbi:MAG: SEL1-like repeat protein [Clostridia bacterium]|nr:SEL1-like repeat protein [Clostridia bacterium]
MIKCKNCGYEFDYNDKPCAVCGAVSVIDKDDVERTARELARATDEKNTAKIHACRHLLADSGDVESMREYAKLIEKGDFQLRDIDTAMDYYFKAAEKYDAYSAYRFSRLVSRSSEDSARFFLRFAAVLGSIDSYPEAAELFSSEGKEEIASYYISLAAACDDTISIVNMAKRWFMGVGVEQNNAHAKWYLDKLSIPPISAIKLAHKLRSVTAEDPPRLTFPEYNKYIRLLADNAKRLNFYSAYFYLESILAKSGDTNAETALAILLAEGKGCEKDVVGAKSLFELSIAKKNPAAALYLAEEYLSGDNFEKDTRLAIEYFEKAAALGYSAAYEKIGDIYRTGDGGIPKNIEKAIDLYELAAAGGSLSAKEKADELLSARESFYLDAHKTINLKERVTKDEAFSAYRSAAIATAMGDSRAAVLLAKCYAYGFGTEKDRQSAFFWYKHSAEQGNREAYLYLGFCYSRGFGTEFSYKNAVKYLKAASSFGIRGAKEELELLYKRKMNKMVRSLYANSMELIYMKKFREAARLLSSIESLAYPKALYTLGCLYEFGRGVPKSDRAVAEDYYERAFRGNVTYGSFKDPNSKYKLTVLRMVR